MTESERGKVYFRLLIALIVVGLAVSGARWIQLARAEIIPCGCGGTGCGCPDDDTDDEEEPAWCLGSGAACECGGDACVCMEATDCLTSPYDPPCGGTQSDTCTCAGGNCTCAATERCASAGDPWQPCGGSGHTCECNGLDCSCQTSTDCKSAPYDPCTGAAEDACGCGADFGCDNCTPASRCDAAADPYEPCTGSTANTACECQGAKCDTAADCVAASKCNAYVDPYEPCGGKDVCGCGGRECTGATCTETCWYATERVCSDEQHPDGLRGCPCGCGDGCGAPFCNNYSPAS